jgi:hypothetical protein
MAAALTPYRKADHDSTTSADHESDAQSRARHRAALDLWAHDRSRRFALGDHDDREPDRADRSHDQGRDPQPARQRPAGPPAELDDCLDIIIAIATHAALIVRHPGASATGHN